jgi:coenzyme F420-reducing hydrogenase delta subunit
MLRRATRLLEGTGDDTTLVFACGCTPNLPAMPGKEVKTLTTRCLLRVSESTALKALQSGAARISYAGCVEATCRYPHARVLVEQRINSLKDTLTQLGMEDRLILTHEGTDEDVHLR